jgi:DnaJ-class molecular chaperone
MGLLIIIGVIAVMGYFVSLLLHPWRACRACQGTGRHRGVVYRRSVRGCTSCGGNGRRARLGVNLFHQGSQVWGERAPAEMAAKRDRDLGR